MEQTNFNYELLPIARGEDKQAFLAKISSEDYHRILQARFSWRLSESGYAVAVRRKNGKLVTEYLHKLVMGVPCRHINGDRLDNRRTNLRPIPLAEPATGPTEDIFTLSTNSHDHLENEDIYVSKEAPNCQHVIYSGQTTYTGRVSSMGKPHGFGVSIIENEKQLIGYWNDGEFIDGIIVHMLPSQIVSPQILIVCPEPCMGIEIVQHGRVYRDVRGP